jgi:ribose transport system substrate-binding protein
LVTSPWVRSRLATGAALVAATAAVAACGSSSGDNDQATASSKAGTATTASASDTAAKIAALTTRPTKIAVTTPIGKPVPTGKKVIYIPPPLGDTKSTVPILDAAAKTLGWTAKILLPTAADPAAYTDAIDEAIREKADAIILVSMPGAALTAPIGRAKAAGIPVVNLYASEANGTVPGIAAQPLGRSYTIGVAEKTGELLGLMVPPGSTVGEAALLVITKAGVLQEATERGVKTTCPTCKYAVNVTTAAQAKDYVPNIVNFIRKDNIKGMYIMNGPLSNGLGPAMKAAGEDPSSVKSLAGTIDAADGSAQRVQNGEAPLAAGYVWPGAEGVWYAMDAAARAIAGVSTAPSETPPAPFIVVSNKIPADVLKDPVAVAVQDYQQQFAKLWGK